MIFYGVLSLELPLGKSEGSWTGDEGDEQDDGDVRTYSAAVNDDDGDDDG